MRVMVCLLLLSSSCTTDPQCDEPVYLEDASDEAYLALVDARDRMVTDDSQTALWVEPAEGASWGADAAPTLSWTSPLVAGLMPMMPMMRGPRVHPSMGERALSWLSALVVPTAQAHLPPITGDIHWLEAREVGAAANACPTVHGLTTATSWATGGEVWNGWRAKPGSYELTIISAYLEDNRITEGPFQSAPRRVQVQ